MNGRDLTLGLVGALALGAALGRRGSRSARDYMEGECDVMSIALHRLTGLPISAIWDGPFGRGAGPAWNPDSAINHVVVMVDAHRYLDATGLHTHPHRLEPMGPARYGGVAEPCPTEESVVSDLFSTATMSAEEREQAIQTAIQHVHSDPELHALVNQFSVGRGSRATTRPPAAFRDLAAWTTWARTQGVELRLAKTPSYTVEITDLFADTTGTGAGTRVMQALVQAADKAGMPLTLHPSSRRNVTFYERFGFGITGRDGMMRREPKRGSRATDPTSTPAFRRWFGESKVVDAEGRPLVVYHGSPQEDIEVFEAPKRRRARGGGFFFSDDPDLAGQYGTNLYSMYLYMVRPLIVDAKGADWSEIPQQYVPMRGWSASDKAFARTLMAADDARGFTSTDGIADLAGSFGFDGAIIQNVNDSSSGDTDGLTTVYVVFEPTQIKSATNNRGTFDPADPRITFNRSAR